MTHSELIERLEQLTGPDREVDRDIALETTPGSRAVPRDKDRIFVPEKGWEPGAYSITVRPYTASVDAALSLAECVLPGWRPSIGQNVHHGYWYAMVGQVDEKTGDIIDYDHIGHTPALALLIAILKAANHDN